MQHTGIALRVRGFSLLELLVAVAVFAVISAVAYGGLSSVLKTRQLTDQHARQLQVLQQTMATLQRDLAQAVARPVRDPFGDIQPALYQREGSYLLAFTRAGRSNLLGRRQSELQHIAYGLEEDRLLRYVWPVLDAPQGTEPYTVVLLEGVRDVQLRFLDGTRQWQGSWPPALLPQELSHSTLPLGVEFLLELEQWGSFRRVIALVESPDGSGPVPPVSPGQTPQEAEQ